jgi:hypothetical protein
MVGVGGGAAGVAGVVKTLGRKNSQDPRNGWTSFDGNGCWNL